MIAHRRLDFLRQIPLRQSFGGKFGVRHAEHLHLVFRIPFLALLNQQRELFVFVVHPDGYQQQTQIVK